MTTRPANRIRTPVLAGPTGRSHRAPNQSGSYSANREWLSTASCQSVLYRCVQEHLETWLAHCRDGHDDEWSVPEHVEREFRRYLDCGILAHGFARAPRRASAP